VGNAEVKCLFASDGVRRGPKADRSIRHPRCSEYVDTHGSEASAFAFISEGSGQHQQTRRTSQQINGATRTHISDQRVHQIRFIHGGGLWRRRVKMNPS
jgi:hypothetical protein